jgi:bifunctional NMN adenylyltransferase/nudix hydrolase
MQSEEEYITEYKKSWSTAPYPPIFVTTDAVVHHYGNILIIKRGRHPGMGTWALPGGFLNEDELLYDSCIRELKEETSLDILPETMRQSLIHKEVFDTPNRSKRGRTITHAFYFDLKVGYMPHIEAADDASEAVWVPTYKLQNMYEDHLEIINKVWKNEQYYT